MIEKIVKVGDIKPFVKQGFFDSKQIEKMFANDRAKLSYALDTEKSGYNLVNLLSIIFEKATPKPDKSLDEIIQFM